MSDRAELVKVMSYNIQGHALRRQSRHIHEVGEVILDLGPDLAGLQEVHRNTLRGGSRDQLKELADQTGMEIFFGRSVEGWGGEYGNAVMTRGTIVSGRVHPLPGAGEPRTLLEVLLELRGMRVTVFVTHLAAWFLLRRRIRWEQLKVVTEIVRSAVPPYILVGDFNASPRTREVAAFLQCELLRTCGDHRELSHRQSRQRLDYVLADPSWVTHDSRVVRVGPSDHWPLLAELSWRGDRQGR